jgi:hypothetical protein
MGQHASSIRAIRDIRGFFQSSLSGASALSTAPSSSVFSLCLGAFVIFFFRNQELHLATNASQ